MVEPVVVLEPLVEEVLELGVVVVVVVVDVDVVVPVLLLEVRETVDPDSSSMMHVPSRSWVPGPHSTGSVSQAMNVSRITKRIGSPRWRRRLTLFLGGDRPLASVELSIDPSAAIGEPSGQEGDLPFPRKA